MTVQHEFYTALKQLKIVVAARVSRDTGQRSVATLKKQAEKCLQGDESHCSDNEKCENEIHVVVSCHYISRPGNIHKRPPANSQLIRNILCKVDDFDPSPHPK